MTTFLQGFLRHTTTGVGINNGTVTVKKHADGSTIDSTTTSGTGADIGGWRFEEDEILYPGQFYDEGVGDSITRVHSSKVNGQIGPVRINDLTRVIKALGQGVVSGFGTEFACTAAGTDMEVDVAAGFALGAGQTYYSADAQSVTIGTTDATNPRIDRVVIRFYPIDASDEDDVAKVEVDVLEGTAAASPSAPSLTQTTAVWEESLCQVAVAANATTISSDDLTDERRYVQTDLPTGTDGQVLALVSGKPDWVDVSDSLTGLEELIEDEIGAHITAGSGISVSYSDATGNVTITNNGQGAQTITVQNGDVTVDGNVSTIDFDGDAFNATSDPAGEVNISLNYGTSAGKPAEGDHTHNSFQNFQMGADRDALTEGTVNVTSTSGQTILSDTQVLSSGVTYDFSLTGGMTVNAPSGQKIWLGLDIINTGGAISPPDWVGTSTANGERMMFVSKSLVVVGTGQTVTARLRAKVSGGTGSVGSGGFEGIVRARGVGGVA